MKARDDVIDLMVELEKQLMHLSNNAQGNADLWDAIQAASIALHDAVYRKGGAK